MIRDTFIFIALVCCTALATTSLTPAAVRSQPGHSPKPKKSENQVTQATQHKHAASDTVGVVNGVVIYYGDFKSIMSGYLKTLVAKRHDNVVTDKLYSEIVDSSWSKAVSDILMEREIEKRNLSLTDNAVRDSLIADPPEFLRAQFTDSSGKFHSEYIHQALTDPQNDSITRMIVGGERIRLETERLLASVAPAANSEAEREKTFDAWLRKQKATAKIVNRRTTFGFY